MREKGKHSFKETDLRYDALMDFMNKRREESDQKFKCYKVPVSAIARKFGVAGDEVTDLLRSRPEPCSLNSDDLKDVPWIDFLAVGRVGIAGSNDTWMALATSESNLAITALCRSGIDILNAPTIIETERTKAFSSIITELRPHPASSAAGPAIDLQKVRDRLMSQASVENPPQILLIYIGECNGVTKDILNNMGALDLLHFDSFDEFETDAKGKLRLAFGTGWFGNADRVLYDLRRKSSIRGNVNAVVEFSPRTPRTSSGDIAAAAACKFATFGWLPLHWNRRELILNAAKPGQDRKATVSRIFDEDVRVFPLPRVEIPGEGPLIVNDPEEMANSTWLSYESSYPNEKAFLMLEMTAYGSREKPDRQSSKDGHYFVFPLTFAAIGFLRRILPSVRTEIIGYTPGNSAATLSGVLERLVWLFQENPADRTVSTRLKNKIRAICYPGSLPFGRRSPFDESEEITLQTRLRTM